jgi:predicted nucleic acid-binding protein
LIDVNLRVYAHLTVLPELAIADFRSRLVADAELAALAIEHGLTLCTNDVDCARFPKLK